MKIPINSEELEPSHVIINTNLNLIMITIRKMETVLSAIGFSSNSHGTRKYFFGYDITLQFQVTSYMVHGNLLAYLL